MILLGVIFTNKNKQELNIRRAAAEPRKFAQKNQFSPPENHPTPTALRRPPREGKNVRLAPRCGTRLRPLGMRGLCPHTPSLAADGSGSRGRPTAFSCSLALSVGSLPASQGGIRKRPADVYKASPLTVFQLRRLPQFSRPKTKTAVKRSILRKDCVQTIQRRGVPDYARNTILEAPTCLAARLSLCLSVAEGQITPFLRPWSKIRPTAFSVPPSFGRG